MGSRLDRGWAKRALLLLGAWVSGWCVAQSGEWRQLSYEITGEGVMITGCDKQAQEVRIPETIEGLPVRSIGD